MLATALVLLIAQATPAQTAQGPWGVSLLSELSRESWKFHFVNPSTYGTAELVPHFFEQTYDTANLWFGARLTHPTGGDPGQFSFAMTPQRTRRADDFDTFFLPDGNIVVAGTTGGASLRSWRIAERLPLGHWRGAAVGFEYAYTRHRAIYHDGDGITTTTLPPTVTHRLVTTRETTVFELHELKWSLGGTRSTRRGQFAAAIDLTPVGLTRLTVDLPDKYPGRLLRFAAPLSGIDGRVSYTFSQPRVAWRIGVRAGRTFSWRSNKQLDARGVSLTLDVIPR
jgi:hypothetical protein